MSFTFPVFPLECHLRMESLGFTLHEIQRTLQCTSVSVILCNQASEIA